MNGNNWMRGVQRWGGRGEGGNSFPRPDENIMNEHIYSGGNGALSLVDTLLALIFLILPIVLSQKFWQLLLQTFCESFFNGGRLIPGPINPITWWLHLARIDFHSFPLQEGRLGGRSIIQSLDH